jgi:CubicO group peptidase (beta-lactamase class C family)
MVETVSAQLSDGAQYSPAPSSMHQAAMEKLKRAKEACSLKMSYKLYEYGAPGMAVAVAVDGKLVWAHGNTAA